MWKKCPIELPDLDCNEIAEQYNDQLITEEDCDPVTPDMTRLTRFGDVIYNIWGQIDPTGKGTLFDQSIDASFIKKHYRYVLGADGRNNLVSWRTSETGLMQAMHIYEGTDARVYSQMPIPAPLYYLGDITGHTTTSSFFNATPSFEDPWRNGSATYPSILVNLKAVYNHDGIQLRPDRQIWVPRVTTDFRAYRNSLGQLPKDIPPYLKPSPYFDENPIPSEAEPGNFQTWSWYNAALTYMASQDGATDEEFECREFWKLHTISNHNRFASGADNLGFQDINSLSTRNFAKTTKMFPIDNYQVKTKKKKALSATETIDIATGIQITLKIDLATDTLRLSSSDELGVFDAYKHANENPYQPLDPDLDRKDRNGVPLYNTTHTSFKFNRIGIYAVPLREAPWMRDNGFGKDETGKMQLQVNPDEEPILFAVIDHDTVIEVSNADDGIAQYTLEAELNFAIDGASDDSSLLRNASIFYNLYEDDQQKWYINQLVAMASTCNAVTEMSTELGYIRNSRGGAGTYGSSGCCPTPDLSGMFAPLSHTHAEITHNLIDAVHATEGGVTNVYSMAEGNMLSNGHVYKLGRMALSLGLDTIAAADYSFAYGEGNTVMPNSGHSTVLNGVANTINARDYNTIMNGEHSMIDGNSTHSLAAGVSNRISNSMGATTLSSVQSVTGTHVMDFILEELIDNPIVPGGVLNMQESQRLSDEVGTLSALTSGIYNSQFSATVASLRNYITQSTYSATIGIEGFALGNFQVDGAKLIDVHHSVAAAGSNIWLRYGLGLFATGNANYITFAKDSSVIGGDDNRIGISIADNEWRALQTSADILGKGVAASTVLGGAGNRITRSFRYERQGDSPSEYIYKLATSNLANYLSVLGGWKNEITNGIGSAVVTGASNRINSPFYGHDTKLQIYGRGSVVKAYAIEVSDAGDNYYNANLLTGKGNTSSLNFPFYTNDDMLFGATLLKSKYNYVIYQLDKPVPIIDGKNRINAWYEINYRYRNGAYDDKSITKELIAEQLGKNGLNYIYYLWVIPDAPEFHSEDNQYDGSLVAAGRGNTINANLAFIGGGENNTIQVMESYTATIGGGILTGGGNIIFGGGANAMLTGVSNMIYNNTKFEGCNAMLSGADNRIINSNNCTIAGMGNRLLQGRNTSIFGSGIVIDGKDSSYEDRMVSVCDNQSNDYTGYVLLNGWKWTYETFAPFSTYVEWLRIKGGLNEYVDNRFRDAPFSMPMTGTALRQAKFNSVWKVQLPPVINDNSIYVLNVPAISVSDTISVGKLTDIPDSYIDRINRRDYAVDHIVASNLYVLGTTVAQNMRFHDSIMNADNRIVESVRTNAFGQGNYLAGCKDVTVFGRQIGVISYLDTSNNIRDSFSNYEYSDNYLIANNLWVTDHIKTKVVVADEVKIGRFNLIGENFSLKDNTSVTSVRQYATYLPTTDTSLIQKGVQNLKWSSFTYMKLFEFEPLDLMDINQTSGNYISLFTVSLRVQNISGLTPIRSSIITYTASTGSVFDSKPDTFRRYTAFARLANTINISSNGFGLTGKDFALSYRVEGTDKWKASLWLRIQDSVMLLPEQKSTGRGGFRIDYINGAITTDRFSEPILFPTYNSLPLGFKVASAQSDNVVDPEHALNAYVTWKGASDYNYIHTDDIPNKNTDEKYYANPIGKNSTNVDTLLGVDARILPYLQKWIWASGWATQSYSQWRTNSNHMIYMQAD